MPGADASCGGRSGHLRSVRVERIACPVRSALVGPRAGPVIEPHLRMSAYRLIGIPGDRSPAFYDPGEAYGPPAAWWEFGRNDELVTFPSAGEWEFATWEDVSRRSHSR
jgi:hypothetical protein